MTREETIFLTVVLVNLLIAVLYLLVGALIMVPIRTHKEKKEETEVTHDNRRTYLLRALVMVFFPVVGILFFFFSHLLFLISRLLLSWSHMNLEDITFRKDRVKTQLKADEDRERGVLPMEEAIAVNDNKSLRAVMMNTLRGDIQNSLSSLAMALNIEDSESSHYAASVLSRELNEFRLTVQKLYLEMREEEEDQTNAEELLLDYMDTVLKQQIFTDLEQRKYVFMMEEAAETLYGKNPAPITAERYEGVCMRLLEIQSFQEAEKWCLRLAEQHPDQLAAYTCRLKLYFTAKNREGFFRTLAELKGSKVVIDRETLELIRTFS